MKSRVLSLPVSNNNEAKRGRALSRIVGQSDSVKEVKQQIMRYADFPGTPVLITGETGTGKELVVNALHACSSLSEKPLVKVNCSAIPENLLESEFYGYVKGAFSGAYQSRRGIIQEAEGGILFLDEIATLKQEFQPKLLRFIENGSYYQLGNPKTKHAKVWIIAATNEDLVAKVKQGLFRADLLYRIKSLSIDLPPLRERLEDIELLTEFCMSLNRLRLNLQVKKVSSAVYEKLISYHWPGNIRELKQLINSLQIAVDGQCIKLSNLPRQIMENEITNDGNAKIFSLADLEKAHIAKVLKIPNMSFRKKAVMLGVDRKTLQRKAEKYDIA